MRPLPGLTGNKAANDFFSCFRHDGFAIAHAESQNELKILRDVLLSETKRLLGPHSDASTELLDRFHERGLSGPALNDFRVALIQAFNRRVDAGRAIFEAFRSEIFGLAGPDIAVQKSCNVVIQQPHDIDQSPVHRDSPPNSPFELVIWIPMVRCYETKGMAILTREQTVSYLKELRQADPADADALNRKAFAIGQQIELDFGDACFFWTGLVHAIPVNRSQETRWSLNIRYKNVFSPYGEKGLPDFFRILDLSPLSALAVEREQQMLDEAERASQA